MQLAEWSEILEAALLARGSTYNVRSGRASIAIRSSNTSLIVVGKYVLERQKWAYNLCLKRNMKMAMIQIDMPSGDADGDWLGQPSL